MIIAALPMLLVAAIHRRNEEFQPKITTDFPHLLGIERLKAWSNENINPCEDMYEYSCGGFQSRFKEYVNIDVWQLMEESNTLLMRRILNNDIDHLNHNDRAEMDIFFKTRDYYLSCENKEILEERGFSPIKNMAIDLMLNSEKWENSFASMLGKFQSQGIEILFKPIYSKVMFRDPRDLRLQLLPAPGYSVSRINIVNVFKIFQEQGVIPSDVNIEKISAYVHHIEKMQAHLIKRLRNINSNREQYHANQFISIAELSHLTHEDFTPYMTQMRLENVEKIFMWGDGPTWIKVIRSFSKLPKNQMKYYFLFRLACSHFNKLSSNYKKFWDEEIFSNMIEAGGYDIDGTDYIFQENCILEVGSKLNYLSGHLFAKYAFNGNNEDNVLETQKLEAEEMIDSLFEAFRERISAIEWIDSESKDKILRKLNRIGRIVGYPDWLSDAKLVANYYRPMQLKPYTYFENAVQAQLFSQFVPSIHQHRSKSLERITQFFGYPWNLNAFHNVDFVQIQVNPGLIQRPLFSKYNFPAMNYGSLGMIIAHEIAHGFDSLGIKVDQNGIAREWMSRDFRNSLDKIFKCFVNIYGNEKVQLNSGEEINVDGKLTLAENVADSGGLFTAFVALQRQFGEDDDVYLANDDDEYSPAQMFFLSYAQTWCASKTTDEYIIDLLKTDDHSPNSVRVNTLLKSSEEFARAFGCKSGDNMVFSKEKQCRLF